MIQGEGPWGQFGWQLEDTARVDNPGPMTDGTIAWGLVGRGGGEPCPPSAPIRSCWTDATSREPSSARLMCRSSRCPRRTWKEAHVHYFTRAALRGGFVMHPDVVVVFERFELVWPQ